MEIITKRNQYANKQKRFRNHIKNPVPSTFGRYCVLLLDPKHKDIRGITSLELESILNKLEHDYKVLKINSPPSAFPFDEDYNFYNITVKITETRQLLEEIQEYMQKMLPKIYSGSKHNSLWISYSEHNRQIILNGFFLLAKPEFSSENEQVFYYLYRNPNKIITLADHVPL